MSRSHTRFQERHHGLSLFGKDLVRRCSSHCELCNAQGVKLGIFEIPPITSEPDFEHCIMICDTCSQQIERPKARDNNHWRCLNASIWSAVPAVKLASIAMLRIIAKQERWAIELLEQVYLEPEEQKWLDEIELP